MNRRGFLLGAAALAVAPLTPAAEPLAEWGFGQVESFRFIQSDANQHMLELLEWMRREVEEQCGVPQYLVVQPSWLPLLR